MSNISTPTPSPSTVNLSEADIRHFEGVEAQLEAELVIDLIERLAIKRYGASASLHMDRLVQLNYDRVLSWLRGN